MDIAEGCTTSAKGTLTIITLPFSVTYVMTVIPDEEIHFINPTNVSRELTVCPAHSSDYWWHGGKQNETTKESLRYLCVGLLLASVRTVSEKQCAHISNPVSKAKASLPSI